MKSKLFKLETGEAGGQGGQGFISDIARLQKMSGHSFNDFKTSAWKTEISDLEISDVQTFLWFA